MTRKKPQTETGWLKAVFVAPMLYCLRERGQVSDRKLRLFAAACCRRAWHLLQDERCRNAVAVGECYADGLASAEELGRAGEAAMSALDELCTARGHNIRVVLRKAPFVFPRGAAGAIRWACAAAWTAGEGGERAAWTAEGVANTKELAANCDLLRCIFGNPFRPATLAPVVLTWHDGLVVRLAQAAYEERQLSSGTLDNSRLAVLADALEEAGCTNEVILGHLRGPGPHARGCWPVDLCLGKS
jgi:hypothetical protein